jgi:outer membrane protein OmpA-like peptidoglycan-associated protein
MNKAVLLILLLSTPVLLGAQSTREWFSKGEIALERNQYFEAIEAFENYIEQSNNPEKAYLPLSIAYYESAQLPSAEKYLSLLINEEPDPLAILYYAKLLHEQNKFAEAANYYKKYLSEEEDSDKIKKHILHCRSGIKLKGESSKAFVDNLGPMVNTKHNEIAPVLSPNYPSRLYFSSASEKSEGGKRDPNGYPNEEFGSFTYDMFRIEKSNGTWDQAYPLNPDLNTARNEVLYNFTNQGLVAFFFRGFNMKFGEIVTDTFRTEKVELEKNTVFNSPADASYGDKDIFFVNDSTFIFSAVRDEGFGGYDLYITMREDGVWKDPVSLGRGINSPYHERTAHLSKNGEYLFFSSDRLESIGGYDIFSARWDGNSWYEIKNLGNGINSASDDLYFATGGDDYSAYFSSDRKTGFGGFDIYNAYFKEPIFKQTVTSFPDFKNYFSAQEISVNEEKPQAVKEEVWTLSPLIFEKDQEVINANQEIILDKVASKMKVFPKVELNLMSFSSYDGPKKYDLYFGLKRAEKVAEQLIIRGVEKERIYITACGSAYPAILDASSNPDVESGKLNRRIDFKFSQKGGLPFKMQYDDLIPENSMQDSPYAEFQKLMSGLTYSVQIAASQQLYEGSALRDYRNPLIRSKAGNPAIKYTIGIFDNYNEARNLRYRLLKDGYKGSFVTAYIDGIRKTRDQLRSYLQEYDDLRAYINVE